MALENLGVYIKNNWGAPFIVGFMILLIAAATIQSLGITSAANQIALYAFYTLVVGVMLQFISYLKYKKRVKLT
jgi:uncharacterized membrane protein